MPNSFQHRLRLALQTSPWIILGSTAILLVVVIVLAVQNTNRETRYMSELLTTKGAALIRAVEAGARTGMMGKRWGGHQVQRLLEETARLPDVLFMAVVDKDGIIVAHSDPSQIGNAFRKGSKLTHIGPDFEEDCELVNLGGDRRAFEVHRHFRSTAAGEGPSAGGMMRRHGMIYGESENDWFAPQHRGRLIIVAGLDVAPFEEAARTDIRTTIVLSAILLVLGFGGLVSLFSMQNYRSARQSLRDTSAFANEVVAHLPVGLIATDRSGRITFFNEAAEKITGLTRDMAKDNETDRYASQTRLAGNFRKTPLAGDMAAEVTAGGNLIPSLTGGGARCRLLAAFVSRGQSENKDNLQLNRGDSS